MENMEKNLNKYLREGEFVRWQGRTEDFPLLSNDSKSQILCKWAVTVILSCSLMIAHTATQQTPKTGFMIVVSLSALAMILTPLMQKRALKKNCYWITNQRVIHMTKDGIFYSMDLAEVDHVEILRDRAAKDCLVLGSAAVEDAKKHLRWRASHPMEDSEGLRAKDWVAGMVMYNISNAAAAAGILREMGCKTAA